jgi:hypothetical protein
VSCIRSALALLAALCLTSIVDVAHAHKPSDSYLRLDIEDATVEGQWDIALRDLDFAIGLDSNQDDAITWGEVKAKQSDIAAYALSRLRLGSPDARCALHAGQHLIDNHSDGAYAVLRFSANCPSAPASLEVDYRLFFDIDPQHRGLLSLSSGGENQSAIFSVDEPARTFALAAPSKAEQFFEYVKEGVVHIWTGYDHILFLLSLLFPAVLVRRPASFGEAWVASPNFKESSFGVLKVVTAFTVAHSITLSLATLGVVSLPSRLVESAIAASVVLAAINNIRPVVHGGRWIIAFCFGLIHGFGFASVFIDLGLPQGSLLLALLAFNIGVEIGQLAIVAVFLPLAYAGRGTLFYRRAILIGGSSGVALVAAFWLVERALNVALLPGLGS